MNNESWIARNPHAGLIIFSTLCASITAIIFLSNWPTWHYLYRGGLSPLWYFALSGMFVIPIIFAEPGSAVRCFKEPLLWWFAAYVFTGLLWLLLAQDFMEAATQEWRLRLLSLLFFYVVILLVSDAKRAFLAFLIIGCVLLASAANWYDVMRPFQFIPKGIEGGNPGRGAGMFGNANGAAIFVVMGAIVALPFVPMRLRAAVLLAVVIGVAPTLSRQGFIYAGLLLVGAITLKLLNRIQILLIVIAIPLLVGSLVLYYDTLMISSDSSNLDRTVDRLRWFEGDEDDSSVEGRKYAALEARDMFLDAPVLGKGIGATTRPEMEGPHNMYLMLMAEQGMVGFALYLALIVVLYRRGRRLTRDAATIEGQEIGRAMILYAVFIAVQSFFSHNVLTDPHKIFCLAFIATAASRAERRYAADPVRPPRFGEVRAVAGRKQTA